MEYLLIQKEAWESTNNQIDWLFELAQKYLADNQTKELGEWMEGAMLAKKLNISTKTLHSYKERGLVGSSLIGRRVFYQIKDVETLINDRYNRNSKANNVKHAQLWK